ncbi:MAG: hypothetical protein NC548_53275 [Lachnospiraceae bacterium]|nr:hypothetical protein [Lachnospiraceae bacterium]
MYRVILAATSPTDYNNKQTEVGSPLKTLKGSIIKRSKYGVGKAIGGSIYLHRSYHSDVIPEEDYNEAVAILEDAGYSEEDFNCIRWDESKNSISFQEAPDFDTAREPVVGDFVTVDYSTGKIKKGHSDYVWHHRWLWCKNDYIGFDVKESWEWSREWLNTLTEPADGNGIGRWKAQLQRFGLE